MSIRPSQSNEDRSRDLPRELDSYNEGVESGPGALPTNPVLILHRLLRGRYRFLCIVAGLLAVGGALVGWGSTAPVYRSSGYVRVAPTLPRILYNSDANDYSRFFESHVAALATLLKSRPVIQRALDSGDLIAAGWPEGPAGVALLQGAVEVNHRRGEQIISVSVDTRHPAHARVAVDSLLHAFKAAHGARQEAMLRVKEPVLRERETQLQGELDELFGRISDASDFLSPAEIANLHAAKMQELAAVNSQITELEYTVEDRPAGVAPRPQIVGDVPGRPVATGPTDPLHDLRERERGLIAEITSYRSTYGPHHPMLREMARQLDVVRIQMQLREEPDATPTLATSDAEPALVDAPKDAALELAAYRTMRAEVEEEATALRRKQADVSMLFERVDETKNRLAETRSRLDELRIEARQDSADRITIAALGDEPFGAYSDKRTTMAMIGILFGMGVALVLTALLGILDPRCRYADQLESIGGPPVLATLPDLRGGTDGTAEAMTRCIHRMRNLLQLRLGQTESVGTAIVVTGAESGSGTTSLTLALASSFTAAGWRTLVVDADVTHAHMTEHLGLGGEPGLCDTSKAATPLDHVVDLSTGFAAMPVGTTNRRSPEELSKGWLERFLAAAQSTFDLVLIDSGPALTCLETPLLGALSDGVILAVGRDQMLSSVLGALDVIERNEGSCFGLVLNRAGRADLSTESALVRFIRRRAADNREHETDISVAAQFLDHPPTQFIPRRKDAA